MATLLKAPIVLLLSTVLSTVFVAGAARADVVDINLGGANLYALGDFNPTGAVVQGSLLVAGNLNASNYTINQNNRDAFGASGYALVVGGNLNYNSGTINNGSYYVGGTSTITSNTGLNNATVSTALPVSFADTSAALKSTSAAVATVAQTGSATIQYGGMTLTGGSGGNVQVFDITAADLGSVNYFNFANLNATAGVKDTLILNISGSSASLQGGYGNFANYNVLYNFFEATNLNIGNTGLTGTVLAPLATVVGSGNIIGSAVVGNWAGATTVETGAGFQAADVAGFVSAVPEPETYAMLLAGLGLVGFMARRRKAGTARA